MFEGRSVLITGGTGSLGRALLARLLGGTHGTPERVLIFSRDESKQLDLRLQLQGRTAATDDIAFEPSGIVDFAIGDVRDLAALQRAVRGIDIVVHAAALKQVPICEEAPSEAVATNVLGAQNLVHAIMTTGASAQTVVGVSTDKACEPVNVMGMTKAIQERTFIRANDGETRFICVRYGNVVGSRGSVVPLFRAQVAAGTALTLTDPDMTRFLLPMDGAVDTIMAALADAAPGEVVVPEIASARMGDIADVLREGTGVEVTTVGVRPGEKTHELLVSATEAPRTRALADGFLAITPMLPGLASAGIEPALTEAFSSRDAVMSREDLVPLLAQ